MKEVGLFLSSLGAGIAITSFVVDVPMWWLVIGLLLAFIGFAVGCISRD